MTDQTVSVPVELLQRLFDNTTLTRDVFAGDSVEVRPSAIGALIDIKSFLPEPPKVGDTVTAAQIADLPDSSVLRDNDGDVLVKVGNKVRRVTMDIQYLDTTSWDTERLAGLVNAYSPITLVSLPRA